MAKEKVTDPAAEKKEKKDKKDKKRKHDEVDEVEIEIVGEKIKKKDKKRKSVDVDADADGDVVVNDAAPGAELAVVKDEDESEDKKAVVKSEVPMAALVPFANPLCDEKAQKKVLKSVKKAAKYKSLKRGVKESVKAIRKSPLANPTTSNSLDTLPPGIVVLAADISPMDVISHIPVLCEDHNIPYVYVPSRAELGAAGQTKRPTSIVMLTPKAGGGGGGAKKEKTKDGESELEEWDGVYRDLHKLALKMGQVVKV